MFHALLHDVKRQLTLMLLAVVFFLYVLDEFLTLGAAALVKARIDIELIGIDQLRHLHTEKQRLTVALSDAEASQQLWGNLAHLVVSIQKVGSSLRGNGEMRGEDASPVILVLSVAVPCITPPSLVPQPVTVYLKRAETIGPFVGGVGPVPIGGLRIEVQSVGVMYVVHSLHRLLDERWR